MKKIFLGVVVGNALARWFGTEFETPACFGSHSRRLRNVGSPRTEIFRTHAKKIFLGIVVGNAPIRWLGTELATPARFQSRSWEVPKCWLPWS